MCDYTWLSAVAESGECSLFMSSHISKQGLSPPTFCLCYYLPRWNSGATTFHLRVIHMQKEAEYWQKSLTLNVRDHSERLASPMGWRDFKFKSKIQVQYFHFFACVCVCVCMVKSRMIWSTIIFLAAFQLPETFCAPTLSLK